MENDHLGFACPRCGTDLVVPASAAGVEGPCPKCGGLIRAPRFTKKPEEVLVRLEVPTEAPVKAKPVGGFQPVAEQPMVASTVMQASRRAGTLRAMAVTLIFVAIAAVLVAVILSQKKEVLAAARPAETEVAEPPARNPVEPEADGTLDPRSPPEGMDVQAFVTNSAAVLGEFLTAGSLEKRLPLMETTTPREELERSVLAGDLRANGKFESLEVKFDKVQGANEVLFKGEFADASGGVDPYLILVRTRGTQSPKIVVDPFLDTFGGRFAAFAETPREGQRKFAIIATVFDFCSDPEIPEHELKYTMKISSCPGSKDLAKAYFGKASPLREKLEKMNVPYGRGSGATVTVRWNTMAKPYLEVIDAATLDWSD